ncbi:MAG: ABC-2 transporter permease [Clostridium sp.]|nr:ABC-2 transporter permease [Clostridium sp.]
MFNLVLKDFKLISKYNIFIAIYGLILSLSGLKMGSNPGLLYVISIIIITYISVLYSNGYDDKYKIHVSLNSMPIIRKEVVMAKYTSFILQLIFTSGIIIIFTLFLNLIGIKAAARTANIWDLIVSFNILGLFYTFYFPLYYKYDYNKLRIFNMGIYFLILIMPGYIPKLLKYDVGTKLINWVLSINNMNTIQLIILAIVFILLIISYILSSQIYSKKEF